MCIVVCDVLVVLHGLMIVLSVPSVPLRAFQISYFVLLPRTAVLPRILRVLGREVDCCVSCRAIVIPRAMFRSSPSCKKPSETVIDPNG